ncbi:hypothetical protein ABZV80_40965 [Streptomyces sp. NPDC005132]|uniref:hypothetical protein n=1 Tax=Streptomyces sp. NPDC005132 TaxID=3154294 RepID=UPI0033A1E806
MITPDPATPEGAAVIDLHEKMQDLEQRTGEWPGADTVTILDEWLAGLDFARPPAPGRWVTGSAWVLRRQDRHEDTVTLWADEASALASLARDVRSSWDNVGDVDGIPGSPPADDRAAVDLYYGPRESRGDEDYWLYPQDINTLAPPAPHAFRFPGPELCAWINSAARFHPMSGPDDTGLPCIEVGGVLVFAYLDPDMKAVRISVDLDTTTEQLQRSDATIPLHIQIGNSTVFSAPAGPVPANTRTRRLRRWLRRIPWMGWQKGD